MASRKMTSDRLAAQNAMKTVLANIRFASVDKPVSTMVITSSIPNEGKSTIAVDLAQSIASGGNSVLLVECDMRNRTLADRIGVRCRGGVYAVLSGQMSIEDAVVSTKQAGMYFLDSEPHIPNPADILASQRFIQLIDDLDQRFDCVIFDTPPVGTFVDAAEVGSHVDGAVFVVRENFAKRNEVMAAFEQLRKAGVHVIGAIMNYCESDASEYYYAYYNQDGRRTHKSDELEEAPSVAETKAVTSTKGGASADPRPDARGASPASPVKPAQKSKPRVSPSSTSQFLAMAAETSKSKGKQAATGAQGVTPVQQSYSRFSRK